MRSRVRSENGVARNHVESLPVKFCLLAPAAVGFDPGLLGQQRSQQGMWSR